MSTKTTIVTVFILGMICGVLIALMWMDRDRPTPDDRESKQSEWREPMATRKSA